MSIKSKSFAILSLASDVIFSSSFCLEQARNILSPIFAPVNFIISFSDSLEKNFPTGPFAETSFSIVKYARPEAPCSFAHLSILSKKLLGLSFVFLVTIHLTIDPDFTSFLKISNDTSSLEKILSIARDKIAKDLNLINEDQFAFCWIVDYPMYELDEQTKKIKFSHNPFSMPQGEVDKLDFKKPLDIKAYQYDIVCNGIELSSGAIRNHIPELMYKLFLIAGYEKKQVDNKFSGMINALSFGAPPHGGIAPGIDRIVMLITNAKNIREVTLFSMNQNAQDLIMKAPS